jgi:hypothetical protein
VKIAFYSFIAGLMLFILSGGAGVRSLLSAKADNAKTASWKRIEGKGTTKARRLESITWNSVDHHLIWEVSKGEKDGDNYKANGNDRYDINMDNATMTVNGESRRFNAKEAANVRILMDFISKYALESTLWWENGEGDPVDGKNAPKAPDRQAPDRQQDPKEKEGSIGSKVLRVIKLQIPAE